MLKVVLENRSMLTGSRVQSDFEISGTVYPNLAVSPTDGLEFFSTLVEKAIENFAGAFQLKMPASKTMAEPSVAAPTLLASGDIAFSAFQSSNATADGYGGDAFEFVLLKAITAGTTIFFTDGAYRTDTSRFDANEGMLRWVAQTDLPFGTIVTWRSVGHVNSAEWSVINPATGAAATTPVLSLASSGENLFAVVSPTFFWNKLLGYSHHWSLHAEWRRNNLGGHIDRCEYEFIGITTRLGQRCQCNFLFRIYL
jgi:hypothetical protein